MRRYKSYIPGIIIGAVIVIIIAAAGFFAWQQQQSSKDITDVNKVMQLVNKHMILPTGETPALVTVVDKTKLNNDFLKKAVNGDKVLIYQKNQRAIIYRPSADRIVDVGPVQIDTPSGGSK
ncbi:MAG: hypothetical protein JWO07_513 [Candidatus Saccharibacteria bacterium]|nr:hypothetical protein [Candidatus Saccharibacteria bacterium]